MPSSSDLTSALPQARQQAEADEVELSSPIIYKVIEEMEDAMKGMLILSSKRKSSGKQLFVKPLRSPKWVPSVDLWSLVVRLRDSKVRVIRDGVVICDGALALKHFKDDVREITNGREGGIDD